jgi:hypothetical protein
MNRRSFLIGLLSVIGTMMLPPFLQNLSNVRPQKDEWSSISYDKKPNSGKWQQRPIKKVVYCVTVTRRIDTGSADQIPGWESTTSWWEGTYATRSKVRNFRKLARSLWTLGHYFSSLIIAVPKSCPVFLLACA